MKTNIYKLRKDEIRALIVLLVFMIIIALFIGSSLLLYKTKVYNVVKYANEHYNIDNKIVNIKYTKDNYVVIYRDKNNYDYALEISKDKIDNTFGDK